MPKATITVSSCAFSQIKVRQIRIDFFQAKDFSKKRTNEFVFLKRSYYGQKNYAQGQVCNCFLQGEPQTPKKKFYHTYLLQ